ncbi:hypothetical protein N7917_23025 [Bacillus sp. OR9]|nr:hypothetical protein [Bacillus sp. OR9]
MWFDKITYLQTLPNDLEKMFTTSGWSRKLFLGFVVELVSLSMFVYLKRLEVMENVEN